jgi:hypothetical protein
MLFNGSSDNYSYYHTPKRATSPSRETKERSSSSEPSSNEKEQVMNMILLFIIDVNTISIDEERTST